MLGPVSANRDEKLPLSLVEGLCSLFYRVRFLLVLFISFIYLVNNKLLHVWKDFKNACGANGVGSKFTRLAPLFLSASLQELDDVAGLDLLDQILS